LFQKFYRIDNSATRTIGGTGLGLYLCRQMIELFNGRIWVESKPNQGSSFNFSLPRLSEEEVRRLQQAAAAPAIDTTVATPGNVVQPTTEAGPALSPQQPIAMPIPAEQAENPHQRYRIR